MLCDCDSVNNCYINITKNRKNLVNICANNILLRDYNHYLYGNKFHYVKYKHLI